MIEDVANCLDTAVLLRSAAGYRYREAWLYVVGAEVHGLTVSVRVVQPAERLLFCSTLS